MRSFNIKALSVSGRGKKIFKAREIAREDELPAGAIDKLIKGGYIEEVKPEAPSAIPAKKQVAPPVPTDDDSEQDKDDNAGTELPEKNTGDGKSEKSTPAPSKNGKK